MIYQTNKLLSPTLNHYGCAVTALAAYREFVLGKSWRVHEYGAAWETMIDLGLISGDLNGDGDMDDPGESEAQDWQKIADFLGLGLKYLGKFSQSDLSLFPGSSYWILTAWKNPRTGFVHWVVGNSKPLKFDPIEGGSVTVAEGAPLPLINGVGGIRVFQKRV